MRDRRARLSVEHLEMVLFLKSNSSVWDEHTFAEAISVKDNSSNDTSSETNDASDSEDF